MIANKTLLQMKYARIISLFAERAGIPAAQALDFFYHSTEYRLMRDGVGDLHCMTDDYIVEDLIKEWNGQGRYDGPESGVEKKAVRLADVYREWERTCETRFQRLKANEEELNRIFIGIYGLQDELTPDVADKDVTVRRADLGRDIRSLISYAVGCMFGRYSLDEPGLILAGQPFSDRFVGEDAAMSGETYAGEAAFASDMEWFLKKKDGSLVKCTYAPDPDNCIPITDEAYFQDDAVNRFVEFIRVVYGDAALEENLAFVAKALGNKGGSSREVIRNYFLNDFIKDHIRIYQKRPIYWQFESGKQNGFKALVYMHRWNADTVGNLRVEYLHSVQRVYEKEIDRMQDIVDNSKDNREINQAAKRREKLMKQLKEARDYDAKTAHVALSRVTIDLDDGVKVNYEKVQMGPDGKSLEILTKL